MLKSFLNLIHVLLVIDKYVFKIKEDDRRATILYFIILECGGVKIYFVTDNFISSKRKTNYYLFFFCWMILHHNQRSGRTLQRNTMNIGFHW